MDKVKNLVFNNRKKIDYIRKKLVEWERKNYEAFPWRETDISFHALIAEVMLQRTRAEQVLPIYIEFTSKFPTISDAARADKKQIRELLKPLGLNWRIEKIIQLIEKIDEKKAIPQKYEELVKLPGVGDYIASAYLSIHKGICKTIIDSNAIRLWGRVYGIDYGPETRRKKEFKTLIERITPTENCRYFNLGVLDFSRKICKYKPDHPLCPFTHVCIYFKSCLM